MERIKTILFGSSISQSTAENEKNLKFGNGKIKLKNKRE
jgi:hypothetical protein